MPLLPDPIVAGEISLAVFLVTLGFLVVFVEGVPRRILVGVGMVAVLLTALLALAGEWDLGLIPLAVGAALVANGVFEWLTTR